MVGKHTVYVSLFHTGNDEKPCFNLDSTVIQVLHFETSKVLIGILVRQEENI